MAITGRGAQLLSAWLQKKNTARAKFARADLYHQEAFGIANETDAIVWGDWFFAAVAGASIEVTPGLLALSLVLFAPTVTASAHQSVTPSTASVVIATFAPTVVASAHQSVTPASASLAATLLTPTVAATNHQIVVPSTASLTIAGLSPSVDITTDGPVEVTPTTRSLETTGYAPTVSASANQVVTPSPASLSLTMQPASIAVGSSVTITPLATDCTITCYDPMVSISTYQGPKTNYNTRGRIQRHQGVAVMGASSPFRAVRGRH